MTLGAVFSLLAFGFGLLYRAAGILNFAHGTLVMLVGFCLSSLFATGASWAAPFLGIAIGGAFGVAMYVLLFRPLMSKGLLIIMASSLAFVFIANGVALLFWGVGGRSFPPIVDGVVDVPGGVLTGQQVVTILVTAAAFCVLAPAIQLTTTGRATRATADDVDGARCVGINPRTVHLGASFIGGALAGLAAALIVPQQGVTVESAYYFSLYAIVGGILGGFGSTWGPAAGGLALGLVGGLATGFAPEWYDVAQFAVVLLILRLAPGGLVGLRRRVAT